MSIMMTKGSKEVDYEELVSVRTPEGTRTHIPIPHHQILDQTQDTLAKFNYEFSDHTLLLSTDNQRFIGSFTVKSERWSNHLDDYDFKVAVMNSHDKTLSVRFFAGTQVFVCENGQWSSDVMLSHKHTPLAWEAIHAQLRELAFTMDDLRSDTITSFESLKEEDFDSQAEVHDFVVQSCQRKIIPWQHAPHILEHWNNPEHIEFNDRNGYSLFNAYTSHWRSGNPFDLSLKTNKLRGFIDEFKGIQNISSN